MLLGGMYSSLANTYNAEYKNTLHLQGVFMKVEYY
jgi:hypothetical protein